MKIYVMLTRRRLAMMLAVLLIGVAITGEICSVVGIRENGRTNRYRVEYISNLGYTLVSDDCIEKRNITIPSEFSDVYNKYNDIQCKAGYDLKPYAGCDVTVYTYLIEGITDSEDERRVNLLVYNGRIIGGDVSSVSINGSMQALNGENNFGG